MSLSVAVCDDEKTVCEYLRGCINGLLAKWDIDGSVTLFNDGEPLAALYEEGNGGFDLIFLDITMKNCDGLSAAKRIRSVDKDVMIVFVTASAEYVFSGYEVRAFRYILKPELRNGFESVFKECVAELTRSDDARYVFQNGSESISLPVRDILFFESNKRIITVRTVSGREYSFYGKLDDVAQTLKKQDFVRCHQSYLINAVKISSLSPTEAVLSDGSSVPVSKHRAKETNEAFLWAMR